MELLLGRATTQRQSAGLTNCQPSHARREGTPHCNLWKQKFLGQVPDIAYQQRKPVIRVALLHHTARTVPRQSMLHTVLAT